MCLAIPGKVVEIYEENGLLMGSVDYSGMKNKVCLMYVPTVSCGQYVIVHAGFALNIMNEDDANKTLELMNEYFEKGMADEIR